MLRHCYFVNKFVGLILVLGSMLFFVNPAYSDSALYDKLMGAEPCNNARKALEEAEKNAEEKCSGAGLVKNGSFYGGDDEETEVGEDGKEKLIVPNFISTCTQAVQYCRTDQADAGEDYISAFTQIAPMLAGDAPGGMAAMNPAIAKVNSKCPIQTSKNRDRNLSDAEDRQLKILDKIDSATKEIHRSRKSAVEAQQRAHDEINRATLDIDKATVDAFNKQLELAEGLPSKQKRLRSEIVNLEGKLEDLRNRVSAEHEALRASIRTARTKCELELRNRVMNAQAQQSGAGSQNQAGIGQIKQRHTTAVALAKQEYHICIRLARDQSEVDRTQLRLRISQSMSQYADLQERIKHAMEELAELAHFAELKAQAIQLAEETEKKAAYKTIELQYNQAQQTASMAAQQEADHQKTIAALTQEQTIANYTLAALRDNQKAPNGSEDITATWNEAAAAIGRYAQVKAREDSACNPESEGDKNEDKSDESSPARSTASDGSPAGDGGGIMGRTTR